MIFENLRINRIIVHEVFQRTNERAIVPPVFADALETLSPEAMGAFRLRMSEALSGQTQSLQMRIERFGAESLLSLAETLVTIPDDEFVGATRFVAQRLSEAQLGRRIPGGMLIVFDGTVGAPAVPFFGVIKAETQKGFRRVTTRTRTVVEFLENIFLTPATRLYKIGLFVLDDMTKERPDGRRAFVFDSNISLSNREAAAAYFYEAFLGCSLPSDGPYETARFFDLTREFVRNSDLPVEDKRGAIDSLYVFVRDDKDATFTADQFGDRYLPEPLRDGFTEFMKRKQFTPNAVVRDTSQMGTRLRRRRLKFGSDIELSASPEALASKVQIEAIEGDVVDGQRQSWTQVTIRAALTGEQ